MTVTGICSNCGERLKLKDGLIPYHDFPKPCRSCCVGSKSPCVKGSEEQPATDFETKDGAKVKPGDIVYHPDCAGGAVVTFEGDAFIPRHGIELVKDCYSTRKLAHPKEYK